MYAYFDSWLDDFRRILMKVVSAPRLKRVDASKRSILEVGRSSRSVNVDDLQVILFIAIRGESHIDFRTHCVIMTLARRREVVCYY